MTISVSRRGRAMACIALMASTAGCATVTRGTHEAWKVVTSPTDATVETSNGFSCNRTPCTFKLQRRAAFNVTVSRDGYKPFHGLVVPKVASAGVAGMAGNVLIGGLIGGGVDASDGAMMELSPNPMIVDLEKADQAAPTPASVASVPSAVAQAPAVASPATPIPQKGSE
jgi:hypothetical protein